MPKCVTYVPGIKWYLCVRKLMHQGETLRYTVKLRNVLLFQLQSTLDLTSTTSPRYTTLHFMWWVNGG